MDSESNPIDGNESMDSIDYDDTIDVNNDNIRDMQEKLTCIRKQPKREMPAVGTTSTESKSKDSGMQLLPRT